MLFFNVLACFGGNENTLLFGLAYAQRGILEIGGTEQTVSIFVKSSKDRHVLQIQGDFGMLAKLELDSNGIPTSLSGSPFFKAHWAGKYVLRDFRILLGFAPPKNYSVLRYPSGLISSVRTEGYEMRLEDYTKLNGRDVPLKVSIRAGEYKIQLRTILK